MVGWLQRWFGPKPIEGERLFQPPPEVSARKDSIDEALARDAEHMTPGRRVTMAALTTLSAFGSLHQTSIGGPDREIMKVWGADVYERPTKVPK